jgi:hypothetical protein
MRVSLFFKQILRKLRKSFKFDCLYLKHEKIISFKVKDKKKRPVNMFNIFKNVKAPKAPVTSDFNDAFKSIQNSKEKLAVKVEDKEQKYSALTAKGMNYLKIFSESTNSNNDSDLLCDAATSLTEALEIKKNNAEPYFYLAYIFYLMKQESFAEKYLEIVTYMQPDYPGLDSLKEKINSKGPVQKINTEVYSLKNYIPAKKIQKLCLT